MPDTYLTWTLMGHFYRSNNHCEIHGAMGFTLEIIPFTGNIADNGSMPQKIEKKI